jgi:Xaa-Pro aminopeptidase
MSEGARLARRERVRAAMDQRGVDALLLSLGADLPWLTGYDAMPLERLTMLVLPAAGDPTLVVPRLEAPRVVEQPDLFALRPWEETEDPVEVVASLVTARRRSADALSLAISDRAWATFLLQLQRLLPAARWSAASTITAPLRAVKDETEVAALAAASAAADRVAADLIAGRIALIGRTEAEVSADIGRRLVEEGHHRVHFAIVGSGPNAASPHHDAGLRRIEANESVVCDFGGTMGGYCSDITRTVFTGTPPAEFLELYRVLQQAQAAAVGAATVGTPCEDVDAAARRIIEDAGYGPQFFHRTGHGIGREEHEDPYIVSGNSASLVAGHAFSVEPGIYVSGRFGARIEDIVVATEQGPRALNGVDHDLAIVEA